MIKALIFLGLILIQSTLAQDLLTEITDPTVKLTIELAKAHRQDHPYQDFTVIPDPQKKGYLKAILKSSSHPLNYKDSSTFENSITVDQAKQIYIYFRDENYAHMVLSQQAIITQIFNQAQEKSWISWCNLL